MLKQIITNGSIPEVTTSHDLSTGSLSFTTTILGNFRLLQILVKSSVGITETFTTTFDSKNGSNYDVPVGESDFDGTSSIALIGGDNLLRAICSGGDQLILSTAGLASVGILYITLKYELLQ